MEYSCGGMKGTLMVEQEWEEHKVVVVKDDAEESGNGGKQEGMSSFAHYSGESPVRKKESHQVNSKGDHGKKD